MIVLEIYGTILYLEIVEANESCTEMHRCSEAVVSRAEVWGWPEEGQLLAELERAAEARRGVECFSERDGWICVRERPE